MASQPGSGKLNAYIDDFRFWKSRRTGRQIKRWYASPVGGGTNYNEANISLGVYYKFNEGVHGTENYDSNVIDYSGRATNATWYGKPVATDSILPRLTTSAIVEATGRKEFKDPVIYSSHPEVKQLLADKKALGALEERDTTSQLWTYLPTFIAEENNLDDPAAESDLKNLLNIIGSYFDELFLQIQAITELKTINYDNFANTPAPFVKRMLEHCGLDSGEIFMDASVHEMLHTKNDDLSYERNLYDVKNLIYKNIYNNLNYIYKSKGTMAGFKNLIRCFGIDEDILKINLYASDTEYKFEDDYKNTSIRKKYIDFDDDTNKNATIVLHDDPADKAGGTTGLIGALTLKKDDNSYVSKKGLAFSIESEFIFPKTTRAGKASLFGYYQVITPDDYDVIPALNAMADDTADMQVYVTGVDSPYYDGAKFSLEYRYTHPGNTTITLNGDNQGGNAQDYIYGTAVGLYAGNDEIDRHRFSVSDGTTTVTYLFKRCAGMGDGVCGDADEISFSTHDGTSDDTTGNIAVKIKNKINSSALNITAVASNNTVVLTPGSGATITITEAAGGDEGDAAQVGNAGATFATSVATTASLVEVSSPYFSDVYDDTKWNFCISVYPAAYPFASEDNNLLSNNAGYIIKFSGVQVDTDTVVNEFTVETAISDTDGPKFLNGNKRVYLGATRTSFADDSTAVVSCNAKAGHLRAWLSKIEDSELKQHAIKPLNYGVDNPMFNILPVSFGSDYDRANGIELPKAETLMLDWQFDNLTTTDTDGVFWVNDFSSGSAPNELPTTGALDRINYRHAAKGFGFKASSTDVLDKRYIFAGKLCLPESVSSDNTIRILSQDDVHFTLDSKPKRMFLAVEKSMYQNISEEMLKIMHSIVEFGTLVGAPVNKYRSEYKDLNKLREIFYRNIENTPDLERYIEFYKWFDRSLSEMLQNLVPATAERDLSIKTMIESHVLERNKYQHKFPSLGAPGGPPETIIRGHAELDYNWRLGHAPIPLSLYYEDFNSVANDTVPSGWTTSETDETPALGPVIKANSGDATDKIFALNGRDDSRAHMLLEGDADEIPYTAGGNEWYRWVQLSATFTQAVVLSFRFMAGGAGNVYGITATPSAAAAEHLWVQYRVGTGNWTNAIQLENTDDQYKNTFSSTSFTFNFNQSIDSPLQLRWVCRTTSMTVNKDHWGIDNISITEYPQNSNCLWWKERAERYDKQDGAQVGVLASAVTNDALDIAREEIREAIVYQSINAIPGKARERKSINLDSTTGKDIPKLTSIVSGTKSKYEASPYFSRRLNRHMKLRIERQTELLGGSNFEGNKKHTLYRSLFRGREQLTTNMLLLDFYTLYDHVCDDELNIRNKRRLHVTAYIDDAKKGEEWDADSNLIAPFSVYERHDKVYAIGARKDYAGTGATVNGRAYTSLEGLKAENNLDITNIHVDSYGDDRAVPMQGPFTAAYVGGFQHRNVRFADFDPISTGADDIRPGAWVFSKTGKILLFSPLPINLAAADKKTPKHLFSRDEFAKRPLNIRNIKDSRKPATLPVGSYDVLNRVGNYEQDYQLIQISGRDLNNRDFVKNNSAYADIETLPVYANEPCYYDIGETSGPHSIYYDLDFIRLRSTDKIITNLKTVDAGDFVNGVQYTIAAVNGTDFTEAGAPNSNVGTTFIATADGAAGGGTGYATTPGPHVVHTERIFALRTPANQMLAHNTADLEAPVASGFYRYAILSTSTMTPDSLAVDFSFEFWAGGAQDPSVDIYGLDRPEAVADDLWIQYKLGTSGAWTTIERIVNTGHTLYTGKWTKRNYINLSHGQTAANYITFRFISRRALNDADADHWAFRNIRVIKSNYVKRSAPAIDYSVHTQSAIERLPSGYKNNPGLTVTAGSFVVGETYTILSPGNTDFTLIGGSDSIAGTRFIATGAGAENGTATTTATLNSDYIIVERFSSPGSAQTMTASSLDRTTEQFSAYNALSFRNLSKTKELNKASSMVYYGERHYIATPTVDKPSHKVYSNIAANDLYKVIERSDTTDFQSDTNNQAPSAWVVNEGTVVKELS